MADAKFEAVIAELNKRREANGLNMNGKLYSMVKDRVEVFRLNFGAEYGIDTHVDFERGFNSGAVVVATAKITDKNGVTMASGHAMEIIGGNMVNEYSPVEAAETSAIGRALACFGMHGGEFASGNEMQGVDRKQEAKLFQQAPPPTSHAVKTQVEQFAPKRQTLGLYVPDDHDSVWLQPDLAVKRIEEELTRITHSSDLGRYWSELEGFMVILKKEGPAYLAQLKAAFATANNKLEFERARQ